MDRYVTPIVSQLSGAISAFSSIIALVQAWVENLQQ